MRWKMVNLGDIVTISKGKKHNPIENGKNRYINIENLHNASNSLFTNESGVFVVEKDLIIAWDGANAGKVGVGFKGVIGSTLARMKIKDKESDSRFLYWFLDSKNELIKSQRTGATIPHVNGSAMKDLQIPLPPLPVQKRIAEILDAADALNRKDQELLKKYDELAQAIFIDMFGDPVKNEKVWEVAKFDMIGTLERGVSKNRPRNAPELLGGKYPLIQTGDVANSGGIISKYKSTYSEIGLKQSKLWKKGTLCITIAANIAKTGILDFDACFPDSIVGFKANITKSNVVFVQYWLGFLQKILEDNAPESAQKNINLEILRGLDVICPPIDLQNLFEEKIKLATLQKNILSENGSNELFDSLIQKAFKGELN